MNYRPIRAAHRHSARYLVVFLIACLLSACGTTPDKNGGVQIPVDNPFKPVDNSPGTPRSPASARDLKLKADQLYRQAHKLLNNAEYASASKAFDKVITRYPFTRYATQSELEQIYAEYRNYQTDAAGSGADRFLREHPRHPHADYVLYLKGLIDESRDQSLLRFLPIDTSQYDQSNKQRAFQDFALLLQRYPHSKYDWNARQRMIALRNDIAAHQLDIARFYTRRGAWLAAAKRAQNVIADYPGAPATAGALLLLKRCYAKLGLTAQEQQVDTLITANRQSIQAAKSPATVSTSADIAPPAMVDASSTAAAPASAESVAQETNASSPKAAGTADLSGSQHAAPQSALRQDANAQPATAASHTTPTTRDKAAALAAATTAAAQE